MDNPGIATLVSGSRDGGFIVDMHDGESHAVHISHADDAEAAEQEGHRHFDSLHRRKQEDGEGEAHPHHSEVTAMREEIDSLKSSVTRLETNVADMLKNRDGVKTEADRQHAQEVRDLQARVDKANDTLEHHRDGGEGDHVERDAHGQDVRDPSRVKTAATGSADEPPFRADRHFADGRTAPQDQLRLSDADRERAGDAEHRD